jgi:hypothetical protein
MDLTVRDWERIGRTPLLVFLAVAKADEEITASEITAYIDEILPLLKNFEVSEFEHDTSVFQWALDNAAKRWEQAAEGSVSDFLQELKGAVSQIRSRWSEAAHDAWRAALWNLAKQVAEASSTGFWRMEKVNDDERDVLRKIAHILKDHPVL